MNYYPFPKKNYFVCNFFNLEWSKVLLEAQGYSFVGQCQQAREAKDDAFTKLTTKQPPISLNSNGKNGVPTKTNETTQNDLARKPVINSEQL